MSYQKPSIASLGVASRAIQTQSGDKRVPNAPDALISGGDRSTGSAYDLDE